MSTTSLISRLDFNKVSLSVELYFTNSRSSTQSQLLSMGPSYEVQISRTHTYGTHVADQRRGRRHNLQSERYKRRGWSRHCQRRLQSRWLARPGDAEAGQ